MTSSVRENVSRTVRFCEAAERRCPVHRLKVPDFRQYLA